VIKCRGVLDNDNFYITVGFQCICFLSARKSLGVHAENSVISQSSKSSQILLGL